MPKKYAKNSKFWLVGILKPGFFEGGGGEKKILHVFSVGRARGLKITSRVCVCVGEGGKIIKDFFLSFILRGISNSGNLPEIRQILIIFPPNALGANIQCPNA